MKRIAVRALFFAIALASILPLAAQAWKPTEIGVGLVAFDGDDSRLKVVQRGKEWNVAELLASGALNGRSDGTGKFALWIQGKRDKAFLDKDGRPAWNWSYRITWPDGKTDEFGQYGLKDGAFDASMITFGSFASGKFKAEVFIHERKTGKKFSVGKLEFTAVEKASEVAPKTPIAISDLGVGLVIMDAEYDSKLKIHDRGKGPWDMGKLLASGALNGRTDGNPHFSAWIVGPPVSTYQDESGRPKWLYRYRLTYPDGKSWESDPAYFRAPGFAGFELGLGGYGAGTWKLEFFIISRDGKETWPAGTVSFETVMD